MRRAILKVLIAKEAARLAANRGAFVLAALLIVFSLILSLFAPDTAGGATPLGGVQRLIIDYWTDGPWIDHLRNNPPPDFAGKWKFRHVSEIPTRADGILMYPMYTAAIQIRDAPDGGYVVWFWHPGNDPSVIASLEQWFLAETGRYFRRASGSDAVPATGRFLELWKSRWDDARRSGVDLPPLAFDRTGFGGGFQVRWAIASGLVLFAQFLFCVYLMSALACEERELGSWDAQRLSPARLSEFLAAKAAVFPTAGVLLGLVLVGIAAPAALARPFTYLAVAAPAVGSFGLGMIIAALARTQRSASLGALCYTLSVVMFILMCQMSGLTALPYLFLEFHAPRLLQDVIGGEVGPMTYLHAAATAIISAGLLAVAGRLMRSGGDGR